MKSSCENCKFYQTDRDNFPCNRCNHIYTVDKWEKAENVCKHCGKETE